MFEEVDRYFEEEGETLTDEEEVISVKWKHGVLEIVKMNNHEENGFVTPRNRAQHIPTLRLADYFVVVGYKHEGEHRGKGVILQRFPTKDWDDVPFIAEIELFCQPQGWALCRDQLDPRFFVAVLTDVNGNRHYCSCLSFHEPVSIMPSNPVDEEEDVYGCIEQYSVVAYEPKTKTSEDISPSLTTMYAPKCLVLMSRLYQIEVFRNCLGTIFTAHLDNSTVPLENLVGNLLGAVQVALSGGQQLRFSIGGGDRQAIHSPMSESIPVTNTTVAMLFQQMGINNVLTLFCAVMTEQKILFHSSSINRLTDACHALTALMFPFRYSHVYIPLLPSSIIEVTTSPTPYIIGVHSSAKSDCTDLMDVIIADLDGGSITVPDGISVPPLPEFLDEQIQSQLSHVLHPELAASDYAFQPLAIKSSNPVSLDKEIRAVFLRMFAQLLQGYRSCLVIIRIHPKPVIRFHKAKFLGERGLTDKEFVLKLLDCMFFIQFIQERGAPWRVCDIWDDAYNDIGERLRREEKDLKFVNDHIQELAQLLLINESSGSQQYVSKIMKPFEGSNNRGHMKPFPTLNASVVQDVLNEGLSKQGLARYHSVSKQNHPRIVPFGPKICHPLDPRHASISDNSARRLEVLRTCVNDIFENKISEARKSFHAVTRTLKNKTAKLVLCQELGSHISGAKAVLNTLQFDMVVKLMHVALQDCSNMDEHGVAAALLPLACEFYRKLGGNVKQFAFTCIQDHSVWKNQQFWESVFYVEVEKEIRKLYIPGNSLQQASMISNRRGSTEKGCISSSDEHSALEIAAEQLRLQSMFDSEKMKNIIGIEESMIVAQAVHFLSRMTYMLVPLDTPARRYKDSNEIDEDRNSNITSMAESESAGGESGFEDQDPYVDSGGSVKKFIARFVDKVCTEGGVPEEFIRRTHSMITTCVDMHIEDCESVHKETKRLPPIPKPKIPTPALLAGELMVMDSIRVYLLPDGREDGAGGAVGGPVLLPAEGALFFTNYRLIFKGTPCDPFACEQTVIRSFPVASLTKDKRINVQYLAHLDQLLQYGLQLRSATFQLLKLACDEEVGNDVIDFFLKSLHKVRHPQDIWSYFAFAGHNMIPTAPLSSKDKNTTLKGFTKKAIQYTAKKAGLKTKSSNKHQKYVLRNWSNSVSGGTLPALGSKSTSHLGANTNFPRNNVSSKENLDGDDVSLSDDDLPVPSLNPTLNSSSPNDSKNIERLMERSYCKDWKRMGLGTLHKTFNSSASTILSKAESFRISLVNTGYMVCPSYPALLVVPNLISEESVRKVARCYKGGRFPVITWKHPRTRALLVRGASCNNKGIMPFLKAHPHHPGGAGDTTTHVEHDNFLRAIVHATPMAVVKPGSTWISDSNFSLDSMHSSSSSAVGMVESHGNYSHVTPEAGRKSNAFMKAMSTLRYAGTSGGKGMHTNWTTGRTGRKSLPANSHHHQSNVARYQSAANVTLKEDIHVGGDASFPQRIQKAAVYVLGEKSQMKGIKTDPNTKIEYVPVEFCDVRQTRAAFKKLMRACLPSTADQEQSFLKAVENSEWLNLLSNILWLSAAVVDLIDEKGSSVILCLEDGTDMTSQVSSIAQICLDPYYRTLEGFQTLIHKEWLAFGHKFTHRNNSTGSEGPSSNHGFAPIFLQFLDIVHQLLYQFPLSFEFNDFFLRFLAYHSVSARFRTFLADNELERVEYGFMAADDKRGSLPRAYKGVDNGSDEESHFNNNRTGGTNGHQNCAGQSIFDYIERHNAKSPVFYNFDYEKNKTQVLRPMRQISALHVWKYYTSEDMATGASYDFEVASAEYHSDDPEGAKDIRKSVMAGYDVIDNQIPDSFRYNLVKHHQLEQDQGRLPQKWKQVWDKLEPVPDDETLLTREPSVTTLQAQALGRSMHRKSTMDILVKGKMVRSSDMSNIYAQAHRFEKHTFTTLTHCDTCSTMLLGKTGLRCSECGVKLHEKCIEGVPKCAKNGPVSDNMVNSTGQDVGSDSISVSSRTPSLQNSHRSFYDDFTSSVVEDRTHEGYLYKRGALLKGWKQRWFVLDSNKHQLRYYDSMEDSGSKGVIELSEVVNVTSGTPTPGAPKKSDERCFFDIRTTKRTYNFCASDASSAQEWIEKIQACL